MDGDPVNDGVLRRDTGVASDEYDTPAEVDAAFRTLRRAGIGYFVTFLIGVGGMPVLTLGLNWWTGGRLFGGMSPAFVMAACGLYVFFFIIGLVAAKLADGVEARMLGGQGDNAEADDWPTLHAEGDP